MSSSRGIRPTPSTPVTAIASSVARSGVDLAELAFDDQVREAVDERVGREHQIVER